MNSNGFDRGLNIIASALSSETTRMNAIASNLANANSVGKTEQDTYHAKHPVFSTILSKQIGISENEQAIGGVNVSAIVNADKPLNKRLEPNNPLADKDGYVYLTDVDPILEMTDMIDASRHYQSLVEVANTEKGLVLQTIRQIND